MVYDLDNVDFARRCLLAYASHVETQVSSGVSSGNECSFLDAFNCFLKTKDRIDDNQFDKYNIQYLLEGGNNSCSK